MGEILQLTDLSAAYMQSFVLTLARVSTIVMIVPILGHRNVPAIAKISLSVLLTIILLPLNTPDVQVVSEDVLGLVLALAKEILVGALVGFSVTLLFAAFQMAAHIIGLQIGLAFTTAMDPLGQNQISLLDQLYSVLVALAFLSINGHHMVIFAIQRTFEFVPLNTFALSPNMIDGLILLTSQMLLTASRIAFPIIAALVLVDVALGIIARVVPQLNVFFVGLPLKVGLGFLTIMLALPVTISGLDEMVGITIRGALNLVGMRA